MLAALALLASMLVPAAGCAGLIPPDGPVVRRFAPIGSYGGHWGVDVAMAPGTPVPAMDAGIVTFAGSIAERRSVTLDHGGGLRTSYSYLTEVTVQKR